MGNKSAENKHAKKMKKTLTFFSDILNIIDEVTNFSALRRDGRVVKGIRL